METLIIWIAFMFFMDTNHDYPMESKSTAPITAYYDPGVMQEIKLADKLHLRLETDAQTVASAKFIWKF